MSRIGLIAVLLFFISAVLSAAGSDRPDRAKSQECLIQKDKLKHLSSSFYLTTTLYYIQQRILECSPPAARNRSALITLTMGIGKELFDSKRQKGYFSWRDLMANAIGIGMGVLFIHGIR